jgi:hypothetical protein
MKIFAEILLRKILWGSWQFSIYLGGANIHKQIHRYIHLQTDVCTCKPKPSYIPTGLTWIPSSRSSQSFVPIAKKLSQNNILYLLFRDHSKNDSDWHGQFPPSANLYQDLPINPHMHMHTRLICSVLSRYHGIWLF